ncbi:hypothetical protein D3C75_1257940 [compost metagenome]
MFDPTIYDNLKVAFENYLYDLDNLDENIHYPSQGSIRNGKHVPGIHLAVLPERSCCCDC